MCLKRNVFVTGGEQRVPLSENAELKPGHFIDVANAPLAQVSWDSFDEEHGTHEVRNLPTAQAVGGDEWVLKPPPEDLTQRLDEAHRVSFRHLRSRCHSA